MKITKIQILSTLFALQIVVPVACFAQTPATPTAAAAPGGAAPVIQPTAAAGDLARDDKNVPVPQTKSDAEIATRLRRIFQLTGWFTDLKVISQEGVVTVSGEVQQASQRDWVINLAQDAEGVVAVINKVDLPQKAWFDLSPAKAELKTFWVSTFAFIPHLVAAILILMVAIPLYKLSVRISRKFWERHIESEILADIVPKIAALPVLLVGLYLVLQVLNLTGLAFTILGGTGAVGLVAGFAFQNILANYFAGIMLSMRKPFIIGDVIEVAGAKGVVFRITTSGTTLVDFDGNHILIPNATIFTSIIKNQTASPITRVHMAVDIPNGEKAEDRRKMVLEFLRTRPEIVHTPEVQALISSNEGVRMIDVYFWINVHETSADKLKSILTARIQSPADGVHVDPIEPSTKPDTAAILARAEKTASPAEDKGRNLISERR